MAKVVLTLNDTVIESMADLRANFDMDEVLARIQDTTLIQWLKQMYYEKEANAIETLRFKMKRVLSDICNATIMPLAQLHGEDGASATECSVEGDYTDKEKRAICEILGVEYVAALNDEEKADYDERTKIIGNFTDNEEVLKHPELVALNQKELAKLLDDGETTVYLCHNEFSVPMKKTGIRYIGIDNPTITNPLTAEQYKKLSITVEQIQLPDAVDADTESAWKSAAEQSGYDFYCDEHSELENAVHNQLKCTPLLQFYHLTDNSADNYFKSRHECEQAAEACIRTAYDEANVVFGKTSKDCIQNLAFSYYNGMLERCFTKLLPLLESVCKSETAFGTYLKLKGLAEQASDTLKAQLIEELEENSNFYRMYHFNYFKDKVEIHRIDYGVDSEGLAFLLDVLTGEGTEYCFDGALDAIIEMNNDLERLVNTYINRAHDIYGRYVTQIEDCMQVISKELPMMNQKEPLEDYFRRISQ